MRRGADGSTTTRPAREIGSRLLAGQVQDGVAHAGGELERLRADKPGQGQRPDTSAIASIAEMSACFDEGQEPVDELQGVVGIGRATEHQRVKVERRGDAFEQLD